MQPLSNHPNLYSSNYAITPAPQAPTAITKANYSSQENKDILIGSNNSSAQEQEEQEKRESDAASIMLEQTRNSGPRINSPNTYTATISSQLPTNTGM